MDGFVPRRVWVFSASTGICGEVCGFAKPFPGIEAGEVEAGRHGRGSCGEEEVILSELGESLDTSALRCIVVAGNGYSMLKEGRCAG